VKGENELMEKKLPIFHPGIPAVISIVFAILMAIVSANWLDVLMKL
jgi:hypothetical protein